MLENILYARAYTSDHQIELLDFVAAKFHEVIRFIHKFLFFHMDFLFILIQELGIFKLLIMDSVMALFRVDYSGRGELAERQQRLGQMMSRLQVRYFSVFELPFLIF